MFRERGKEGEREGEKHQCVVAFCMPPTGDVASNPGVCPRLGIELATLLFTCQHSATEPHLPGPILLTEKSLEMLKAYR